MLLKTMFETAANRNQLWARLLVSELVRAGVCGFVLSPGARSAPLTLAVAEHPGAAHTMHYDERGAAFHALGWARATGRPAVLVCTSGSAAANYMPAVVEAAQSHTPLVALTADRPPELIACGANQAIDQTKLFGDYARWFFELPCPTLEIAPAFVLTTADQAVRRSLAPPAGPVHLNCHFREPLAPTPEPHDFKDYLAPLATWMAQNTPFTQWHTARRVPGGPVTLPALPGERAGAMRGIVVIGRLTHETDRAAVAHFVQRLGWPVFPDIASGLRFQAGAPFVSHYDQLLLSSRFCAHCRPDCVLHIGGAVTSKRLVQHLAALRMPFVHVAEHPLRHDPQHQVTHRIEADIAAWCEAAGDAAWPAPADAPWCGPIHTANAAAAQCIARQTPQTACNEIAVARAVCARAPAASLLFLGNSMPVRDADMYAAPREDPPRIAVSRGASGIDGNIATAAGYARGTGAPVTALLGDLAALHDLNSLALLRGLDTPFVLVVINNDGGGIFHFLPVAEAHALFDPYFGTPHGMDFAHATEQFGLGYARPASMPDFTAAYDAALTAGAPVLIEVTTNRAANSVLHRHVQARVAAAAGDTFEA
ncbi:MAG: 2-succinyl-5-enolpyruvyl-6-hydroxy-3-cyclohexene-1-carboxylic-acid synthase [Candidatus Hydrogenedentota bacterium]